MLPTRRELTGNIDRILPRKTLWCALRRPMWTRPWWYFPSPGAHCSPFWNPLVMMERQQVPVVDRLYKVDPCGSDLMEASMAGWSLPRQAVYQHHRQAGLDRIREQLHGAKPRPGLAFKRVGSPPDQRAASGCRHGAVRGHQPQIERASTPPCHSQLFHIGRTPL